MSTSVWPRTKYSALTKEDVSSSDDDALSPIGASTPATPFPRFGDPKLSEYAQYAATRPPITKLSKLLADDNPPPTNGFQMFCVRLLAIGAVASWTTAIVGLVVLWTWVDKTEVYKWYIGEVPFIFDVGAQHKTFYSTTCMFTAFFLTGTICAERYLRATRVLVEATEERCLWVTVGVVDVALVLVSSVALILLSWFDAFNFQALHNVLMQTFLVGIAMSGFLQTVEVEHLWHDHPDRADLKHATVLKWIFLVIAVACGTAFWTLYELCDGDAARSASCYKMTTASAVMEWAAAFCVILYLCTLVMDVWPAYRHAPVADPAWATKEGVQGHAVPPADSVPVEKSLRRAVRHRY